MFDSATPWTVAGQAPLSVEFSRQGYWVALPFSRGSSQPFLPPGDLPDPGIEPWSPALQADSLLSESPGNPRPGAKGHQKECDCSLGVSVRLSFIPVLQQLSQVPHFKGHLGVYGDIFGCYNWRGEGMCYNV